MEEEEFEVESFLGEWIEWGRYVSPTAPVNFYQEGAYHVRAKYTRLPEGGIEVRNSFLVRNPSCCVRRYQEAVGYAEQRPGYEFTLDVWFKVLGIFWTPRGTYEIRNLRRDKKSGKYTHLLVVSHSDYAWILVRPNQNVEITEHFVDESQELISGEMQIIPTPP